MIVIDNTPDAEFVNQCEITTKHWIAIGDGSRLRLFRLAGHTEEPPNRFIEWPSVWEMIADARRRIALREADTEVDRIMALSDEEIVAETIAAGLDPHEEAEKCR